MRVWVRAGLLAGLLFAGVTSSAKTDCDRLLELHRPHLSESVLQSGRILSLDQQQMELLGSIAIESYLSNRNLVDGMVLVYNASRAVDAKWDRGFKVRIHKDARTGVFWMNWLRPLLPDEERAFFQKQAYDEALEPLELRLREPFKGLRKVEVSPYVQIKLRVKHSLSRQELNEAMENVVSPFTLSTHSVTGKPRYVVSSITKTGKLIRMVFVLDERRGVLTLVTAFHLRS